MRGSAGLSHLTGVPSRLDARTNTRAIQELLRHACVTTTHRYTCLEIEDLQAQVAGLPANRLQPIG
jgi:site-specific recombinase XerC